MNMNRLADANKKDSGHRSGLADMAGPESVQASTDWDSQSGAFDTHPSLFGTSPLYPGLLQRKPRGLSGAGPLPPPPSASAVQLDGELIDSLQLDEEGGGDRAANIHQTAAQGISGSGGALPHLDTIQKAFGRHTVDDIQAHTDDKAKAANQALGANAYATGSHVALDDTSLHTVAHEAAHVVQQRTGVQLQNGVGKAGDPYEQHADAVADAVVQGKSAERLLDQYAGGSASGSVQKDEKKEEEEKDDDNASEPASATAVAAKESSARNGLLQHKKKADGEEDDDDEDQAQEAPSATAVAAKESSARNGLLQLKKKADGEEDDDDEAQEAPSATAVAAKESSAGNGLLQLDEKTEDEEKKEEDASESAPASAVAAKESSAGNGLLQLDEKTEDEEKKEEDASESAPASAVAAKESSAGNGLLQLDEKSDAPASAASSTAPEASGKKKSPVKPAQALAQVKSTPSGTPAEAPAGEVATGAGTEATVVRPMADEKADASADQKSDDAAPSSAAAPDTQRKAKNVQLDKGASKSKYGIAPPKLVWNGLTFDGIEGDIHKEFYKSEFPKRKLFKVSNYWPFPAFPFAGIDTAAGADIEPEIGVTAKGTYKWNPVEAKYEFTGAFETSAAVTLKLWARGGLAINLVIQSGGVGLEASSSLETKASASAAAGFKLDGKTGAMEGSVGATLDIGATWKAALALACWTEGWFYDDIWRYTFAETTIGTFNGFKLKTGWTSGKGFSWGIDPSSGTFNWGAAPDNPQK